MASSVNATEAEGDTEIVAAVSFPIKANGDMFGAEGNVHFTGEVDFATYCTGGVGGSTAKPGHLCVFRQASLAASLKNAEFLGISPFNNLGVKNSSRTGAVIRFKFTGAPGEGAMGFGSYSVTGCSASLPEGDPNKCP